MLRRPLSVVVFLILTTTLLYASPVAGQGAQTGVVTASALNVRAGPGVGYARVGVLYQGNSVTILEQSNGWYRVRYAGGEGWVAGGYIRIMGSAPATQPGTGGGGTTPAATPVPPAPVPTPTAHATAAGSGKIVLQVSSGGAIYTINPDGSGLTRVGAGIDPAWSPDGRQIAYANWNEPRGLYVMNSDGSGARRLFDWPLVRQPAWSPDGGRIAFSRQIGGYGQPRDVCYFGIFCFTLPADPWWRLAVVSLADGGLREPLVDLHAFSPSWSPDGARIAYDGDRGLRRATLDDQVSQDILADISLTDPRWCSLPGGRIAATYRQHEHWEIYTLNGDGSGLTRLTWNDPLAPGRPADNVAPAWSPDCARIAFLSNRDGLWRLYVMNADGTGQRPMFGAALDHLGLNYGYAGDRVLDWR